MHKNHTSFELLAPGGDADSIKAAIIAGADAIYCGLDRFNARNRATNLSLHHLKSLLALAHQHQCKIFVTLNIIILESEIPSLFQLLNQLANTTVDGVIIQDLGLGYLLKHHFPTLDIHASTQMNTHNQGQILFTRQLGVSRVNLSRELSLDEIRSLTAFGLEHQVLTEVFIHGSYCIGFSGHCYISSARNGSSGNRGRCSQPCRDTYQTTAVGINHPLNMKDNSAYHDIDQLLNAGVYSLKVEGRMKKPHYVYTVVKEWRRQIDDFLHTGELHSDMTELYTVFNRDFSTGYLNNHIGRNMFIDNPRDNSAAHFVRQKSDEPRIEIQAIKQQVYDKKTDIIGEVDDAIAQLMTEAPAQDETHDRVPYQSLPPLPISARKDGPLVPHLSVLLDNPQDIDDIISEPVDVYYQMPVTLDRECDNLIALFQHHSQLLPWFPAVVIGDDYVAAERFLQALSPRLIITDNSGVAYLAGQMGIDWIAGPQLNTTNSWALHCLQNEYAACGAFLSDEINAKQMKHIRRPESFRLYYNIFHPVTLLTSRQCLFQQTTGCRKSTMNRGCLPKCEKHTSIINLNGSEFIIQKQRGSYNSMYGSLHCLNTEVLTELEGRYTDVMIDLRDIKTHTRIAGDKATLIKLFHAVLNRDQDAERLLQQTISGTSNQQYRKGL